MATCSPLRPSSLTGPAVISFDYSGLAHPTTTPAIWAGFWASPTQRIPKQGTDIIIWYAGTIDSPYPGLLIGTADDGLWHHYQIPVNAALGSVPPNRGRLRRFWRQSGAMFISITSRSPATTAVPEPTSAKFGRGWSNCPLIASGAAASAKRLKSVSFLSGKAQVKSPLLLSIRRVRFHCGESPPRRLTHPPVCYRLRS